MGALTRGLSSQAIAFDPEHADAHNNLGSVLFRLGRTDEAEAEYRTALRLKPDSAAIKQNLSVVLRSRTLSGPSKRSSGVEQAARMNAADVAHERGVNAVPEQGLDAR